MSEATCSCCGAPVTLGPDRTFESVKPPFNILTTNYTYAPPTLDAAERAVGKALGNQAKGGTMDRIALSEETNIALDALFAARAAAKKADRG